MTLNIKFLAFILLFTFGRASADERVTFSFEKFSLPITSGYQLKSIKSIREAKLFFEKVKYEKGIRLPISQFNLLKVSDCGVYCETEQPPSFLKLIKTDVIDEVQAILWEVKGSSDINDNEIKIGVIKGKEYVLVVTNDEPLWSTWNDIIEISK